MVVKKTVLPGTNNDLPRLVAGQYFYAVGVGAVSTTVGHGTNSLRVAPLVVERTLPVDRIGVDVATVGDVGSKVRLGIYADNGNSYPGALLVDAGQVAGDATGSQEATIALTLYPGVYWIGGVVQSVTTTQPTLRSVIQWTPPVMIGSTTLPTGVSTYAGYTMAGVTGALPSTFSLTVTPTGTMLRSILRTA